MPILRGTVTQSGADTFTQLAIDTDLTADGKSAWSFNALRVFWFNGKTAAVADSDLYGILSTKVTTVTTMSDTDEIARVGWQFINQGGVAVAYPNEPIKSTTVAIDRVTVQPTLYFSCQSAATGQANQLYFEADYEVVKLTDIEVLRLLVGGA